jgi:lipid II isoglutaminyl synthase (glutamine-hydrolysing)
MLFTAKLAAARATATATRLSRAGGGTTLPGKLLLRMEPDAIGRLAGRLASTTVISATNGKTTTAKMAAAVLEADGRRLCRNAGGANLTSGVASALLAAGRDEEGLFEVDEAALPAVVDALRPGQLVLGNLFRDQLDRYGELELIGDRWRSMVSAPGFGATVIHNVDDPLVASIGAAAPAAITFGLEDDGAARTTMQHAADSKWCPRCGTRLVYEAVYLGHLGRWRCPACRLERPRPEVRATAVRADGLEATEFRLELPRGDVDVRLPIPGLYNVYNALAAAAACVAHGVSPAVIGGGLERFSAAFGRFERITLSGRPAVLLLVKNPAGTNEVIRTLAADARPKTLLLALNDRIADGRDVSWIWDVDFEELVEQVDSVVATGTRAAEMALRLKYAGVSPARIAVEPQLGHALDALGGEDDAPAYLLATYTAMLDLRGLLEQRGLVRPYWEAA